MEPVAAGLRRGGRGLEWGTRGDPSLWQDFARRGKGTTAGRGALNRLVTFPAHVALAATSRAPAGLRGALSWRRRGWRRSRWGLRPIGREGPSPVVAVLSRPGKT